MKVINNIMRGIAYVGQVGALVLGFLFVCMAIFGGDSSLSFRIFFGGIALIGFSAGYLANEEEAAKHREN